MSPTTSLSAEYNSGGYNTLTFGGKASGYRRHEIGQRENGRYY
jgi:hypothetical protein